MRILEAALVMLATLCLLLAFAHSPSSEELLDRLQSGLTRGVIENLALNLDCMIWAVVDGGSITKHIWVPTRVDVTVVDAGNSTYLTYKLCNETLTLFYPFKVRLSFRFLERGDYLFTAKKIGDYVEVSVKHVS